MYLLDTNAMLFYLQGDDRLSKLARNAMENHKCYFSIVSLWEVAIKQSLKKLNFKETIQDILKALETNGFEQLPIFPEAVEQIKQLDFIHRDPFDRMLIAQAKTNNLTLITSDSIIHQYDVNTLW